MRSVDYYSAADLRGSPFQMEGIKKKGAGQRPAEDTVFPARLQPRKVGQRLGYVCPKLLPELPLNGFHLVFEPELQLFESDFFELFVFAEITLLGQGIEATSILCVFL